MFVMVLRQTIFVKFSPCHLPHVAVLYRTYGIQLQLSPVFAPVAPPTACRLDAHGRRSVPRSEHPASLSLPHNRWRLGLVPIAAGHHGRKRSRLEPEYSQFW